MERNIAGLKGMYEELAEEHGVGSNLALGWSTKDTQEKRFWVILRELEAHSVGTMLDVGCGVGEIINMPKFGIYVSSYYGVDLLERNIETAMGRYGQMGNTRFKTFDFLGNEALDFSGVNEWDFVVASGTFHHYLPFQVAEAVKRMWAVCERVMVFNLTIPGPLHIPAELHSVLENVGVEKWRIFHDYVRGDVTVVGYKEGWKGEK